MITYVTSFNQHLYESTGKSMMESFQKYQGQKDQLFVATEDGLKFPDVLTYNLDDDCFLHNWLKTNKDLIPKIFGGEFECNCKEVYHMKGHSPQCLMGQGMRWRAAHWFRKITTWKIAAEKFPLFVWVDCDSIFKRNIARSLIADMVKECPVRFHYGQLRRTVGTGIESGVTVFDVQNGAKEVIDEICLRMLDKSFRQEKRWDDAWMLTVVCRDMGLLDKGDLTPKAHISDPVTCGPFSKYITHKKGVHWKKYDVNKQRIKNDI